MKVPVVFADPHFHGIRARFQHGNNRAVPPTLPRSAASVARIAVGDGRNRHIPSRHWLHHATPDATSINKRTQRVSGICRRYTNWRAAAIAIRPLCILCSPTSDISLRPLFRHPARLPIRKHRCQLFRLPVTLLAHQLLLAPAPIAMVCFRLMSFSGQIIRPCPERYAPDGGTVSGSLSGRQNIGVIELKVVEDQRTRAVMDNLERLSKKAQSYSSASITKNRFRPDAPRPQSSPAHRRSQTRFVTALFQNPGRHSRRSRFPCVPATASTQRSRSTKSCSHVDLTYKGCFFPVPLPHTDFPGHGVANNHQIRLRVELAGI